MLRVWVTVEIARAGSTAAVALNVGIDGCLWRLVETVACVHVSRLPLFTPPFVRGIARLEVHCGSRPEGIADRVRAEG